MDNLPTNTKTNPAQDKCLNQGAVRFHDFVRIVFVAVSRVLKVINQLSRRFGFDHADKRPPAGLATP